MESDANFEEKLTCAFKTDMKNLANFHQREHLKVSKLELRWDSFIQSRKCCSLKFTGDLCVMTMNNDAKFEEELTCQFKTLTQALDSPKKLHFDGLLLTKVYDI